MLRVAHVIIAGTSLTIVLCDNNGSSNASPSIAVTIFGSVVAAPAMAPLVFDPSCGDLAHGRWARVGCQPVAFRLFPILIPLPVLILFTAAIRSVFSTPDLDEIFLHACEACP